MGNHSSKENRFTRRNRYANCYTTLTECQNKNTNVHRQLGEYIDELDETFGQLNDEKIDDIISALKKIKYDNFNVVPKGGRRRKRTRRNGFI